MTAYYNENDPKAAAWLRELIARGHIAPGVVDERSIEDVTPDDLARFVQCHFFAGIGVWSYALRLAGWPDDRHIWTGSCPCQPFSAAGKGKGTADERHLWPAWFWLVDQCRPDTIFGEQVSSKDGLGWLDLVLFDLEGAGYAIGALDSCAAGVGAPHIRQRLYFGAASHEWLEHASGHGRIEWRAEPSERGFGIGCGARGMADDNDAQRLADGAGGHVSDGARTGRTEISDHARSGRSASNWSATGPTNGFWRDADWLFCRDERWRPVEPGTFPLAHGTPARVVKLRGYGNGLVATHAAAIIEAFDAVTATQPAG